LGPLRTIRRIRRHERASRDEIRAFQEARLRRVVSHAYAQVPWYRRLFDRHRLDPREIRGLEDLSKIPITTKQDLRPLPREERIAAAASERRLIRLRTSGSTGEPFFLWRSQAESRVFGALTIRSWRQHGWRRRDVIARVLNRATPGIRAPGSLRMLARLSGTFRTHLVPSLRPATEVIQDLRALQPDLIFGLTGMMAHVGEQLTDEDRQFVRPRFVRVGAETLTPLMRRRIEEGFKTRLYETYGSWEFGLMASECPQTGLLHLSDDGMIMEILKEGRPARSGETGDVVGTALHSLAMPLIRYPLEDRITVGETPCSCGSPFGTVRAIEGRKVDYFRLPDGSRIDPFRASYEATYGAHEWIGRYRFVQEALDLVALEAVVLRPPSSEEREQLTERARKALGADVRFELRLVDDLPFEKTGKFRVALSRIDSYY
jgi:phenylacetate-CoA ligase